MSVGVCVCVCVERCESSSNQDTLCKLKCPDYLGALISGVVKYTNEAFGKNGHAPFIEVSVID